MIRTSIITRPLFALTAVILAAPLAAERPLTVTGEPMVQESVSFADLDLREVPARMALVRRVKNAAWAVCIAAEGRQRAGLAFGDPAGNCPNSTLRAARPQIRAAIDRARSGQPAIATNLVVSAARVR